MDNPPISKKEYYARLLYIEHSLHPNNDTASRIEIDGGNIRVYQVTNGSRRMVARYFRPCKDVKFEDENGKMPSNIIQELLARYHDNY